MNQENCHGLLNWLITFHLILTTAQFAEHISHTEMHTIVLNFYQN